MSDGTVTWTLRQIASTNNLTGFTNGMLVAVNGLIHRTINDGSITLRGGASDRSPQLRLIGIDDPNAGGQFWLRAGNDTNLVALEGTPSGALTWNNNDLGGSAIVAKKLGENGYIKYASGLIIQWGAKAMTEGYTATTTLPISYTANWTYTVFVSGFAENHVAGFGAQPDSGSQFTARATNPTTAYRWFTIGY